MSSRQLKANKRNPQASITAKLRGQLIVARARKVIPLQEVARIRHDVEQHVAALWRPTIGSDRV